MSSRIVVFSLCLYFSTAGFELNADVIDSYLPVQGPFTVGPGEMISAEEGAVYSGDILGGFRFAAPALEDMASSGSTATMGTGGGSFTCALRFPDDGNPDNVGGCSTLYDRREGPVFDLSGSSAFVFDVQDASGDPVLVVTVGDVGRKFSIGQVVNVTEGRAVLPFNQLIPAPGAGGVDLSLVDNINVVMGNNPGSDADLTLGEFATDDSIGDGPGIPGDDDIVAAELSGSYYDPARSGEGCQLTLERDGISFILTCYMYNDGEQFWVIGFGFLADGQITFSELTVTSGAEYGASFNPADVVRENWGSAIMTWADCNNAELELLPVLQGFEDYTLTLTRVIPVTCGGGGARGDALPWMGSWFWVSRDGEGFQLSVEGDDASVFVLTWYTYLGGKQVWLIGTGARNGNLLEFDEMIITGGTGFGPEFNPGDVVREVWGGITFDFTDCNNLIASVDARLPGFSDIGLDQTKLIPGNCP